MNWVSTACLLVVALLSSSSVRAEKNPHFDEGVRLLDAMEDSAALAAFEKALTWPKNSPKDRARIHFYIGVVHCSSFKEEIADTHFRKALDLDPAFQAPEMTAPKIKERFEKVRATRSSGSPTTQPEEFSGPKLSQKGVVPARWPAWLGLGLSATTAITGSVMLYLYGYEKKQVANPSLRTPVAQSHQDRSQAYVITASVLWAVAGVSGILSGMLLYKRSRVTAAVVPITSGAMIQVAGLEF